MGNFPSIVEAGLGFFTESVEPLDALGNTTLANGTVAANTTRLRYRIRPMLLLKTQLPTVSYGHNPELVNSTHPATERRSIRFAATLNGGPLTLSANATTLNGIGSGVNGAKLRAFWDYFVA